MPKARIAFAGTPAFSVPAFEALVGAGVELGTVLTQPDRPAGRGRKVAPSPVKLAALAQGLPVAQPSRLDDAGQLGTFGPRPDLLVVVAYGLLLPQWVLEWPRLGCVNLHASLLPRWRGAAPIQHAILAGDTVTGVSLMRMERGLDTGAVYLAGATPIGADETAGELHERLGRLAADVLVSALPKLLAGALEATAQVEARATWAPKIAKSDARLDWRRSAAELARSVRAYNPWPVAETQLGDGRRLRVWAARSLPTNAGGPPGTIVGTRDGIDVATGDGVLRLTRVQPPSARVMDATAYLAAHPLQDIGFVD